MPGGLVSRVQSSLRYRIVIWVILFTRWSALGSVAQGPNAHLRIEMLEHLLKHAAHKKKTASAGARTIATVAIATAATSMAAPAMAAEASPLDSLGDLGTTAEGLKSTVP